MTRSTGRISVRWSKTLRRRGWIFRFVLKNKVDKVPISDNLTDHAIGLGCQQGGARLSALQ